MKGSILFEAIIFLAGAVICVPIIKKLGLSSVLGYLIAGILIGPYVFGFIGQEGEDIMHFAEFGVVMMLFLIGLEIEPKNFWNMRKAILGMGGLQVFGTVLLSYFILDFIGLEWEVALVISMAVALSSTAISLQTIKEKNLFNTTYGASSFSILLFQDIIVIVMLAIVPLLAKDAPAKIIEGHGGAEHASSILDNLPIGLQALVVILSVVSVVVIGRYLIVPLLRKVASVQVRELLTASALLIVFGIAFLMEMVGLSPALGAFLGGVVLATSEFKHELESTLEPFKGLLLGLFFMAVGASTNFIVISENPLMISGIVFGVIALKALVIFAVASIFKLKIKQKLLLTIGLAQVGEFAFVLLSFAFQLNILDDQQLDIMLVITALSMTLAPILGIINEKFVLPMFGTKKAPVKPDDHIDKDNKVILVGFGDFGRIVGRFLRASGVEATILDQDSNRVDLLRKMGFEVYYGDATRVAMLESAGIDKASILICTINNPDVSIPFAKMLKTKYPHLKLLFRARNRDDAYDFLDLGIEHVYRESLDTSVKMAKEVMHQLGHRKYTTYRQAQKFVQYDDEMMRTISERPENKKEYIFRVRKEFALQEKQLEEDLKRGIIDDDEHWNSAEMKLDIKS